MCKCKICGAETRKGRETCISCTSTLEVAKKGEKASKHHQERALKHLTANPGLSIISWGSFRKKKRSIV